MKRERLVILMLIAVLALALAACGGDDEPTSTPTPEAAAATDTPVPPTDTPVPPTNTPAPAAPQPTDTPVAEAETAAGVASPSDVLKSYRHRGRFLITTEFPDGSSQAQNMEMEGAYLLAPHQYGSDESLEMTISEGDSVETMSIYKIGDWISVSSENEWITLGREEGGMLGDLAGVLTMPMNEFLLAYEEAEDLGAEEIDGIPATHYRVSDPEMLSRMAEMAPDSEEVIDSVQMDVWVAQDGGYVVKYTLVAQVSNVMEQDASGAEVATTQRAEWSYEVYDANAEFAITLPADAPEPGAISIPGFAEGEFPVPEGGALSANMLGMPEITSDLSQDELVQFYTESFEAMGWSFSGDFGFYDVSKDGVSFAMFFDTGEDGKGRAQIFADQ